MSTPGTCQCGCGASVEEGQAFIEAHDPTPVAVNDGPPALFDLDPVFDLLEGMEEVIREGMVYAIRWAGDHPQCPPPGTNGDCTHQHLCAPCRAAMWEDFCREQKGEEI